MAVQNENTETIDPVNIEKKPEPDFITGVVEGFYGRPWTVDQRKHLFARLANFGLNTYFYAPKDDEKHRSKWNADYCDVECEILRDMIQSAKDSNIDFVFALSPGLDVTYSDKHHVDLIKKKFTQLAALGCTSFALLFDDIDKEMKDADKELFTSFAQAQVTVTNEVYNFLGKPRFYFCPTEYCETRAVPTLLDSEYLNTVGELLRPDIHVMWTGPRVISRVLTVEHMQRVAKVLRRKPLIWDNLFANDYDTKRVFLGPFSGRPVALKNELSGLLLNPNDKYEANFIPLQTFSLWNTCDYDAEEYMRLNGSSETPANLKLYHPHNALVEAIRLWTEEFNSPPSASVPRLPRFEVKWEDNPEESTEYKPKEEPLDLQKVILSVIVPDYLEQRPEANSLDPDYVEPMDNITFEDDINKLRGEHEHEGEHDGHPSSHHEEKPTEDESVPKPIIDQKDESQITETMDTASSSSLQNFRQIEADHVSLLVDMYFLPFETGSRSSEILEQLSWLLENSYLSAYEMHCGSELNIEGIRQEWTNRFNIIISHMNTLEDLFLCLPECRNKSIVAELLPYVWDAHEVSVVMMGILHWLNEGYMTIQQGSQLPFWKFIPDDEPWDHKVGFVMHLFRVLASGRDLVEWYASKGLLPVSYVKYSVQPVKKSEYQFLAKVEVEDFASMDEGELEMYVDRNLNWIAADSNYVFAVIDEGAEPRKLMSYAAAALNGRKVAADMPQYIGKMKAKYMTADQLEHYSSEEIRKWFPDIPQEIFDDYPSWVIMKFKLNEYEAWPTKRLLQVIVSTLALSGSTGFILTVPNDDNENTHVYLSRLGLHHICYSRNMLFNIYGCTIPFSGAVH